MEVKKINSSQEKQESLIRPENFDEFIGQDDIKKVLKSAIQSAKKRQDTLWHILFSWESWFWKTTMAWIIAKNFKVNMKVVTGYAINKPSEMISIISNLEEHEILFIDEIQRIKPNVEEVLYTAMEDFCIDMVMPEWGSVRVPVNKFTLIWATTRIETLTPPLKNRFVYKFHFGEYTNKEKKQIIEKYLEKKQINYKKNIIEKISENIVSTPREISNFCIKLRDYIVSSGIEDKEFDETDWEEFKKWADVSYGGVESIHKKYINILEEMWGGPVWVKTISVKLGVTEKAVENDIEPLLLKLGKIEKTNKWRIINN